MKHLKTRNQLNEASENLNISDVRRSFSFTYEDLFKSFVAGDTENMRNGNDIDREEFEEWFENFFKKTSNGWVYDKV